MLIADPDPIQVPKPKSKITSAEISAKLKEIIKSEENSQTNPLMKNKKILFFIVFYACNYVVFKVFSDPHFTLITALLNKYGNSQNVINNLLSNDIYKNFEQIIDSIDIFSINHLIIQKEKIQINKLEDALKELHENNTKYVYDYVLFRSKLK